MKSIWNTLSGRSAPIKPLVNEDADLAAGIGSAAAIVTANDIARRVAREREAIRPAPKKSGGGGKTARRKGDRKAIVTARVTHTWEARLKAYCAEAEGLTMTAVIEQAVSEYLDRSGFRKTPRGN